MNESIKYWRYTVPSIKGQGGWGILTLDSTGLFAAVSDYGSYIYLWTHHGKDDFRDFVLGLGGEYLMGKLHPETEFDLEKTVDHLKEHVVTYRRDGTYTKEKAREEYGLIKDLEDDNISFGEWQTHTDISDAWEMGSYRYPSDVTAFVNTLMPRLKEKIREQLQHERSPPQPPIPEPPPLPLPPS